MAISNQMACITIQEARSQPSQISSLKRDEPLFLKILIVGLIENLLESFNVKNSMSPMQVMDCTKLIIEEFWYLRPEEIMFAFKKVKTGEYGISYNRMDTPTIILWIRKYVQTDRFEDIERQNEAYSKVANETTVAYDIYAEEKRILAETGKSKFQNDSQQKKIEKLEAAIKKRDEDAGLIKYFEEKKSKQSTSIF